MTRTPLYKRLKDFTADAAMLLGRDTALGESIPFEIVEHETMGSVLYQYRSLAGEFIDSRWERIRGLESFKPATEALSSRGGLAGYLKQFGVKRGPGSSGGLADAALSLFLKRTWQDASNFDLVEERLESAYGELESCGREGRTGEEDRLSKRPAPSRSTGDARLAYEAESDRGIWVGDSDFVLIVKMLANAKVVAPEIQEAFRQNISLAFNRRIERYEKRLFSSGLDSAEDAPEPLLPWLQLCPQLEGSSAAALAAEEAVPVSADMEEESGWLGRDPEELTLTGGFDREFPGGEADAEPVWGIAGGTDIGEPAETYEDAADYSAPV